MLHVQEIVSLTQMDPHRTTKYLYPLWHQLLKVQNHTTSCLKMNEEISQPFSVYFKKTNLFFFWAKRLIISYDTQDNETCK